MNDKEEKQQLRDLQLFLIKTFVATLVLVALAEYGISSLLNRYVLPLLMRYFFGGRDPKTIGLWGIGSALLLVLGLLLLELLQILMPGRFQTYVAQGFSELSERLGTSRHMESGNVAVDMSMGKEALLLVSLLAILVLLLLPILLGGSYYVGVVIRQFQKIETRRVEKQREYEQKRNLMLSDIAHDLRTPITTVNGYAKAISDGLVKEEKKQEYLSAIMAKSQRMNELITYLFDYVKTDSEGFTLQKETTDICELVRECVAMQYQDFEDAGMEPEVQIPEETILIPADRLQLSRSVTNLLTNAIRHNREGSAVGVFVQKREDDLWILVADNGDPIDEEMAKHLFEPFVMGDQSRSSRGGSGLGLSIVKKIVELHGFEISLWPRKKLSGEGTIASYEKAFAIRIPERFLQKGS
ncbi:MAG: HAMP domain-containing histidine kinase [Lachnospiraceae bacterium]|nr:HAMP domain-containing histidine kinase [Lachnospiraceae bacterium]